MSNSVNHEQAAIKAGQKYLKAKVSAMEAAFDCGRELLKVKKIVPHGTFEQWMVDFMPLGPTQCRRVMKLAKNRDTEWQKQHSSVFLGITVEAVLVDTPDDMEQEIRAWADASEPNQAELLAAIKKLTKPAESPKKAKMKRNYPPSLDEYIEEVLKHVIEMHKIVTMDSQFFPASKEYKRLVDAVNQHLNGIQVSLETGGEVKLLALPKLDEAA